MQMDELELTESSPSNCRGNGLRPLHRTNPQIPTARESGIGEGIVRAGGDQDGLNNNCGPRGLFVLVPIFILLVGSPWVRGSQHN